MPTTSTNGSDRATEVERAALATIDQLLAEFGDRIKAGAGKTIAAIYIRYSTSLQDSFEAQLRAILTEAAAKNFSISKENIFYDLGISGAKYDREGLNAIREARRAGKFSVFIALATSRLARNLKTLLEVLDEEFVGNGTRCILVDQRLDSNDNERWKLLLPLLGWLDDIQRTNQAGYVRAAHRMLLARRIVYSTITYGYGGEVIPGFFTKRGRPVRMMIVDDRRLGPGFRFFNKHRVVDEKGKVLGYKKMAELRKTLEPIMLRRTRDQVLTELPPLTTEIVRITPTDEQLEINNANMRVVAQIVRKPYFTEMDFLRLQRSLLAARMSADSTFLNTKEEPSYSSKLERLDELLERLFEDEARKVILFSEWTTMLDLIEKILDRRKLNFVRLDGKVPQKKRKVLVDKFQNDPDCKLFITTNAGSTGLNLQAANTVINVDLPWNPAILEQRIARAHRMGQSDPVQVYLLVTTDTLEEQMLVSLDDKRNLALAVLDADSEVDELKLFSGMEEMKHRLEILIGAKPEAPLDGSQQAAAEDASRSLSAVIEHRERVASAGGEMLGAVFNFLGELVNQSPQAGPRPDEQVVEQVRAGLANCVQSDATGRQQLTITLPNEVTLNNLATTLASLLAGTKN